MTAIPLFRFTKRKKRGIIPAREMRGAVFFRAKFFAESYIRIWKKRQSSKNPTFSPVRSPC